MPNSKCKKCSCYLDDIIKTKEDKIRFVKLLHKRLKKFLYLILRMTLAIQLALLSTLIIVFIKDQELNKISILIKCHLSTKKTKSLLLEAKGW